MSSTVLDLLPLLTIALPLLWLFSLFSTYRTFRSIRCMQRWLEEGRPLEGFQFSRSRTGLVWARRIFLVLLFAAILSESLGVNLPPKTTPLEQADLNFSLLQLADLEGPDFVPDPHEVEVSYRITPTYYNTGTKTYSYSTSTSTVTKIEQANYIESYWRPLAPQCYTIYQSGKTNGAEASLIIDYYVLRSPQLAARTLDGLTLGPTTAVEVPGTDYFQVENYGTATITTTRENQVTDFFRIGSQSAIIYAARGNRVIKVQYRGSVYPPDFYGEIAAMLVET